MTRANGSSELHFETRELSASTWVDFEKLFDKHGGVWAGCWCMFYQAVGAWKKRTPKQNKTEKRMLVMHGKAHGVLVYHEGRPVGWCQFGPREELPRIDTMKNYKASCENSLWRITCFFTDRDYRGKGVSYKALGTALEFMKRRGVKVVEAYPFDARKRRPSSVLGSGTLGAYEAAGFTKVRRFGKNHWMVKRQL